MADATAAIPDTKGGGGGGAGTKAMAAIAKAAGGMGMIGGQAADMEGMALPTDGELLSFIHQRKTGALIRASLEAGMILNGAGEEALASIREYGDALGMVFQIRDDLLDAQGSAEVLGKPVGSDEKNDKKTFVTVYGKEKAQELLTEWLKRALRSLAPYRGGREISAGHGAVCGGTQSLTEG